MNQVIKRNGSLVDFDKNKIYVAIMKAMKHGSGIVKNNIASSIADEIETEFNASDNNMSISDIEIAVFNKLIAKHQKLTAKAYESYRSIQEFKRHRSELDTKIEGVVDGTNIETIDENSNKNAYIASTQRDLIAGEYSKDYSKRTLIPINILHAHEEGILHMHDLDYFLMHIHNCMLVDLDDCLQNGTVINRKMIEKPHSFRTACTVATQIVQQVANGQYGGQTISLSHLAPFVKTSYEKYVKKYEQRGETPEKVKEYAMEDLRAEIKDGIQTIQYQINTFSTSNGQAPFLSVFMYISEKPEYEEETAMLIEETLKQRITGMKNEQGVYITPAFPKLLYVTDENNIYPDSKYYYITQLAAECVTKRMMPDFISAKIMKQEYDGEVFPCMGCVDGQEIITYKYQKHLYVESFERMWNRLAKDFDIKHQYDENSPHLYMDLSGVDIYDTIKGFVNTKRIIRNHNVSNWVKVKLSNGRILTCTEDHPFDTIERGRVNAANLKDTDTVLISIIQETRPKCNMLNADIAYLYGLMLCDASIASIPNASFALSGEDDIISNVISLSKTLYDTDAYVTEKLKGKKGNYKDVTIPSRQLQYDLITAFEGIKKEDRHIPNIIFECPTEVRLAFLAGLIDADGYINSNMKLSKVQLDSTNKEIALQQMALMQSLSMQAHVYENHYSKTHPDKIRYCVECVPSTELINALRCIKKQDNFKNNVRSNCSIGTSNTASIMSVEKIYATMDSYDVTTESDHFEVSGIYSYNCRSFLGPYRDPNTNKYKWYGRFNQGVVTINLVDAGLSAEKNLDVFWNILDERLDLCFDALMLRHERLKNTSVDISPIHWKYGALARLKTENFNELLFNGYSSISLGYAGLYECVMALIGESHTTEKGKKLALDIMTHLRETCDKWKQKTNIGFSLYGTPLESTTYKFARCLKKRFGVIENVTDHDYITNSYHVNVREKISAEDKLLFESQFQNISSGGAISYVESCNLSANPDVILNIIQYMYEHIKYAEINGKFDYCHVCGFHGEMKLNENHEWYCPNCNNHDHNKMNVCRRTCGYLGDNFWNLGRTAEIGDRYVHIDNETMDLNTCE